MQIKIKRFDKTLPLPKYEKLAAGFDIYTRQGATFLPGEIKALPSNLAIQLPDEYVLMIFPRSSTPNRLGLVMPHSVGIIDPFYKGDDNEIMLVFQNITNHKVKVKKGDKLAQGIILKYEKARFIEVDSLPKSSRPRWTAKRLRKT